MTGSTTAFDGRGDATGPVPMVEDKSPTLPLASTPIGAGRAFRFRGRWGGLFFMAYLSLLKTPYSWETWSLGVRSLNQPVAHAMLYTITDHGRQALAEAKQ
jgi:hypothetical protein